MGAGRRGCAPVSSDILHSVFCTKQFIKEGADIFPWPHVAVLFLNPIDPFRRGVFLQDLFQLGLREGIELLDAHKSAVFDLSLLPLLNQIVIDLAAAKEELADLLRRAGGRRALRGICPG